LSVGRVPTERKETGMKIAYDTLVAIAEAAGIGEGDAYCDGFLEYEGCISFDLDDEAQLANLTLATVEVLGMEKAKELAREVRTSGRGLGTIAYYPDTSCDEGTVDSLSG
jgi:hypothetical protein